jgi:hypothetical protein
MGKYCLREKGRRLGHFPHLSPDLAPTTESALRSREPQEPFDVAIIANRANKTVFETAVF